MCRLHIQCTPKYKTALLNPSPTVKIVHIVQMNSGRSFFVHKTSVFSLMGSGVRCALTRAPVYRARTGFSEDLEEVAHYYWAGPP